MTRSLVRTTLQRAFLGLLGVLYLLDLDLLHLDLLDLDLLDRF